MEPDNAKVLRTNMLVLVALVVVLGAATKLINENLIFLFAGAYLLQVVVNVLLAFTRLGRGAAAYFLSALLVLLIGFGACGGMLTLMN